MKKVLITGASRGIGCSIAGRLEKEGIYEILAPTRKELDLSNLDSITNYFKRNKDIDILINNAGINILSEVDSIEENDLAEMLRVNLEAPFMLLKYSVPNMKKQKWGRVINISSIWGQSSKEKRSMYSATKFGLNGVTKSLARELGEYNILVNSICPGFVNTELTKKNISAEVASELKKDIPLARFAEPEEIAEFVAFLVSEKNSYITGQAIIIDGGFLA